MEYKTQIASDVVRDGLGVELIVGDKVLAEMFRCDKDKTVYVNTFDNTVTLEAWKHLLKVAKERLTAFEDGTPVNW